jgi:hypothetical protein
MCTDPFAKMHLDVVDEVDVCCDFSDFLKFFLLCRIRIKSFEDHVLVMHVSIFVIFFLRLERDKQWIGTTKWFSLIKKVLLEKFCPKFLVGLPV